MVSQHKIDAVCGYSLNEMLKRRSERLSPCPEHRDDGPLRHLHASTDKFLMHLFSPLPQLQDSLGSLTISIYTDCREARNPEGHNN